MIVLRVLADYLNVLEGGVALCYGLLDGLVETYLVDKTETSCGFIFLI